MGFKFMIITSNRNRKNSDSASHSAAGMLGYGLELMLTKLAAIEHKLRKMKDELHELRSTNEQIYAVLHKLDQFAWQALQDQSSEIMPKQNQPTHTYFTQELGWVSAA